MGSSLGHMAAEHQRLAEERAQIEAEIAALSQGLPAEAAEIVRRADAVMAAHGERIAELKARRDAIDARFDVTAQERRSAAERQYREQVEANRKALLDEEERRLQAIADAEAATRALADAVNRAIASNARIGALAQSLTPSGKAPMSCNPIELVSRLSGRIASVLMTIRGHPIRFGYIQWPNGPSGLFPADRNWRADESKRMAAGLQPLLEQGKAD
jgi:hypothetical protein